MARRDIIVIGCSLGGVEAVHRLVAALPPKLSASLFVVIHMPPCARNYLADLLRNPSLDIKAAQDAEPIKPSPHFALMHLSLCAATYRRRARGLMV